MAASWRGNSWPCHFRALPVIPAKAGIALGRTRPHPPLTRSPLSRWRGESGLPNRAIEHSQIEHSLRLYSGYEDRDSVPDEIFERAERLAKRSHRSRSELYSAALKEYVARHTPEEVTEAMNRAATRRAKAATGS